MQREILKETGHGLFKRLEFIVKALGQIEGKVFTALREYINKQDLTITDIKWLIEFQNTLHGQLLQIIEMLIKHKEDLVKKDSRVLVSAITWHLQRLPDEALLEVNRFVRELVEREKAKNNLTELFQ